jgi:hypothetical protein
MYLMMELTDTALDCSPLKSLIATATGMFL